MGTDALNCVTCIGAVHWDSLAHAVRPISQETSTPARILQKPGGVATNVARALSLLGVKVTLAGVIGDDLAGKSLTTALGQEELKLVLAERKGFATAQYLAMHNPDGSLPAACVDDRVLSTAAPELFLPLLHRLSDTNDQPAFWFVDANLPEGVLKLAAELTPRGHLFADCVSVAKASRLREIASYIELLFGNRAEAAALTGKPPDTPSADLANRLGELGFSKAILTDGLNPTLIMDGKDLTAVTPLPAAVRDVTGAGDAMIAGTLAGLARCRRLIDAARCGLEAARLTVQTTGAVPHNIDFAAISTTAVELR